MTERYEWLEYLRNQWMVRVQGLAGGSSWTGRVVALTDHPGIVLRTMDGDKVNLPQSFYVAPVAPARPAQAENWDNLGSITGTQETGLRMQSPTVICGYPNPVPDAEGSALLCGYAPHPPYSEHSWTPPAPWQEQAAPVPNDQPSSHDLVIADILSREPRWDLSVGPARHLRDQVAADLLTRKQVGLERYGSLLQAHNGRDSLRDLYEELQDAAVYARTRLAELDERSLEYLLLFDVYDSVVTHLVTVRRLRDAATE